MFTKLQWLGLLGAYTLTTLTLAWAESVGSIYKTGSADGNFLYHLPGAAGYMAVGLFLALAGGLIGLRSSQRGATIGLITGFSIFILTLIL